MPEQLFSQLKEQIDFKSNIPLYVQLKSAIEIAIQKKLLLDGSMLPSERKISQALGLSRITVVKALDLLCKSNMLVKRQGLGNKISLPLSYKLSKGGFSSQLKHIGEVKNRWIIREKQEASRELAKELNIKPNSLVSKIKRVRLINDLPVCIETIYIPEQYLPRPDLLEGSLYEYWHDIGIIPDSQDCSLALYIPDKSERMLLDLDPDSNLMRISIKSYDKQGAVLEFGDALCRGDYFNFDFKLKLLS